MSLQDVGIDTFVFHGHSMMCAVSAKTEGVGLSMEQTMKMANWKSALTFKRYKFSRYHKETKCLFQDEALSRH